MSDKPTPPWANEIPEGSFISYAPTYKVGEYFNRFHKTSYDDITYYFFDPTEHGFEKGKKYPLLVFMHGYTNALEGDICINYTGAEFYSKDDYQKTLGGAYVLVPLANEYRGDDEKVHGSWDDSYIPRVYDLICDFMKNQAEPNGGISKKVIFGNSLGGTMSIRMPVRYPDFFDIAIPVGADAIVDENNLEVFEKNNIGLFLALGKRDEINNYKERIKPLLPRLEKLKKSFIFTPDWVYNGDHGIASINFGFEMGQHCITNAMHCNLMFDDGTPMEPTLPNGVLGWLSEVLKD